MNLWLERNRGYIIVLLLSLIFNGGLLLLLNRPPSNHIRVVLPTPTPPTMTVRVFVSGAVSAPDVYELPVNSLVKDAIEAAGGHNSEADLNQINLARQIKDQEQIFVPARAPAVVSTDRTILVPVDLTGKINLNTASASDFETLPGIGPGLAQRIIEYRANNGSFTSTEEIKNVSGIGDATYDKIKDMITVN